MGALAARAGCGHRVALGHKQAVGARLRTLAEDAGLRDPADLAQQLLLLMDGAWVAAWMFGPHNPGVQVAAAAVSRRHPFHQARLTDPLRPAVGATITLDGTPAHADGLRGDCRRRRSTSGGWQLDTQVFADARLDLGDRAGRVDRHDDLLGAEQLQDRPGLVVVVTQAGPDRLDGIVGSGHQPAAAHVADAGHGRPVGDEVVVDPALRAQPPAEDAFLDHLVGDLEQDDRVQVVALQKEPGLGLVAGEAVDDEAIVPVVLVQAPVDHGLDQVVGDQFAGGHAAPDLGAQLGVVLDVPAEDVADADVFQGKGFGQELGLGAFPAALDAHDDVLAHPVTCPRALELDVVSRDSFSLAAATTALRLPQLHPN